MRLFIVHAEGAILSCRMIILPFDVIFAYRCSCTCSHMFVLLYVANFFQKGFGIIKQLLPFSEGGMTICSPSTGNIALGLPPRAILPASGEQIVMSPSLKGNNCILSNIGIGCYKVDIQPLYPCITEKFPNLQSCLSL